MWFSEPPIFWLELGSVVIHHLPSSSSGCAIFCLKMGGVFHISLNGGLLMSLIKAEFISVNLELLSESISQNDLTPEVGHFKSIV